MAEGGFGHDDPYLDKNIDDDDYEDDDNDDDDDDDQEVDRTQPFNPGQASTPYHGGEQVEMQTMQQEQSGLPSYEETSFGGEKTPLLSDHDIEMRLEKLRRNSLTGVIDISANPAGENLLSLEEQKKRDRKCQAVYQKSLPQC